MEPGQITLVFSLLSAIATGVWTVWTWSEQQKAEIALEQDQLAALYVNPFILAGGVLQQYLYDLLHNHALADFKKTDIEPHAIASPEAFETLYQIAVYFSWEYYIYRYGPYKKDSETYRRVTQVAQTFATRQYPGEAFRFSYAEQLALGKLAIQPASASAKHDFPEYESVPLYQFVAALQKDLSENAALVQYRTIRKTLEAIDRAEQVEQLEGRERLVQVQNQLVELIEYLEIQQGLHYTASPKAGLSDLDWGAPQPAQPHILHRLQGRVRLRVPELQYNESYAQQLQTRVAALPDVQAVSVNLASASMVVNYNPSISPSEFEHRVLTVLK